MTVKNKQKLLSWSGYGFVLLLLLILVLLHRHGGNERLSILLILLKTSGLFASFVLVLGSLQAPFFDRFCPRHPRFDCKAVIGSPAGMIFSRIHVADLGVLYFSGSLLGLLICAFSPNYYYQVVLLGTLNLLALPYTFFSVSYQAFKLGRWCALCLIVQLIFWLEFWQFFPFIFARRPHFSFALPVLFPLLLVFSLSLLAWLQLRYLLSLAYKRND